MFRSGAAIFLLVIQLFNMGGYRLFFNRLEQQTDIRLVERLDKAEYRDEDLVELKVPFPMPYQTNWPDFERYDGEITIDGLEYRYVKRKVWNDTLILLCIPHQGKIALNQAKNTYFSLLNDIDHKGDKLPASPSGVIKSITTDYLFDEAAIILTPPLTERPSYKDLTASFVLSSEALPDSPPPEIFCI